MFFFKGYISLNSQEKKQDPVKIAVARYFTFQNLQQFYSEFLQRVSVFLRI